VVKLLVRARYSYTKKPKKLDCNLGLVI
jgi:hypothetical protein